MPNPAPLLSRQARRLAATALTLCLAAACQTTGVELGAGADASATVWPTGKAPARIRWLAEFHGPEDLGIRPSRLRRLWNWVTGETPVRFVRPYGLSVDPQGRLWVTDPGARRVHVFDLAKGRHEIVETKRGYGFVSPIAVAHDPRGGAYISDSALALIRRFDSRGRPIESWDAEGRLVRPAGLVFDARRDLLWIADAGRHELIALDREGRVAHTVGGRGDQAGRFNFPTHLAMDPAGSLIVTDALNFRIQILDPDGAPVGSIGRQGDGPGDLSKPKGVGLDAEGHIYVVDALFDNVQIFDAQGRLLLYFGLPGSGPGEFWLPAGLWIDESDRIFVADTYNRRIQVFEYLPLVEPPQ